MDPMMVGVGEMIGKSFGNPLAKQGEENGRWEFQNHGGETYLDLWWNDFGKQQQ